MLRVKVSIAYVLLFGLMAAGAIGLVHLATTQLVHGDTAQSVQQGVVGVEQSARLESASLLARAEFVARNDRLYRSLKGEFVAVAPDNPEAAPPGEVDVEGQRHLDAHEKLSAQKYHLDELAKEAASHPEPNRALIAAEPRELDIFMVLDADGRGVAALGKDLYSWFGADVAKTFPEVLAVAKGGMARSTFWMWSFKPGEERRLYRVALAPLRRTAEEEPAGVVVLGALVSDGLAQRKQALFAGGEDADTHLEIAFYRGGNIVGSTFGTEKQQAVAAALAEAGLNGADPTGPAEIAVDGVPYLAISRPLQASETPIGVAVIANLAVAKAPVASLRVDIALVALVLLVLGLVLLVVLIHRYLKPVEDLEDGVQEVIAGNRDYVWSPLPGHDLQSSLAQQLNLMSAFLQGKPMPDDDGTGQGWGDLMPGGGAAPPQGAGQVQGVDLAGLMGAKPKRPDGDEG